MSDKVVNLAEVSKGSGINVVDVHLLSLPCRSEGMHDGSRQRGLAVVHVSDRSDVHVGLITYEFLFGHFTEPPFPFLTAVDGRRLTRRS